MAQEAVGSTPIIRPKVLIAKWPFRVIFVYTMNMPAEHNPYITHSSKTVYKNRWITVREDAVTLPNGQPGIYAFMESKDSVIVTAVNDKGQLYLIRGFSYPSQSWNWQLPGGGSEGDDIASASKRELQEETGIIAQKWTRLGKTRVCDGLMSEQTVTYFAQDLSFGDKGDADDLHLISDGRFFDMQDVHQMIRDGEINDAQSIMAITLYNLHVG